jgi:hypothetical protein
MAEAVKRTRRATTGSYVPQEDGPAVKQFRGKKLALHRAANVAVLMDQGYGSSCEDFLLAVGRSFNVKLLDRHSGSSLAYSK